MVMVMVVVVVVVVVEIFFFRRGHVVALAIERVVSDKSFFFFVWNAQRPKAAFNVANVWELYSYTKLEIKERKGKGKEKKKFSIAVVA